jgi:hypothetical protein
MIAAYSYTVVRRGEGTAGRYGVVGRWVVVRLFVGAIATLAFAMRRFVCTVTVCQAQGLGLEQHSLASLEASTRHKIHKNPQALGTSYSLILLRELIAIY